MAPAPRPQAVFDIDGVLADVRHRLGHLERRPKDWEAFFAAAPLDPPLAEGLALAGRLAADHDVVYLTGRPERLREVTRHWLVTHGLVPGPLYMRSDGDHRPAPVIKVEALRLITARGPVSTIIDDDSSVTSALLAHGWPARLATWAPRPGVLREAQEYEGRN